MGGKRNARGMDLSHELNYNDPLELKEVFRDPEGQEYAGNCAIGWEDVRGIDEYFYPDNWKKYPGEKYYVIVANQTPKLILGSYDSILRHWREFRNKYPMFVNVKDEDNDSES